MYHACNALRGGGSGVNSINAKTSLPYVKCILKMTKFKELTFRTYMASYKQTWLTWSITMFWPYVVIETLSCLRSQMLMVRYLSWVLTTNCKYVAAQHCMLTCLLALNNIVSLHLESSITTHYPVCVCVCVCTKLYMPFDTCHKTFNHIECIHNANAIPPKWYPHTLQFHLILAYLALYLSPSLSLAHLVIYRVYYICKHLNNIEL